MDTICNKQGDTDTATGARKSHSKVTFSGGNPLLSVMVNFDQNGAMVDSATTDFAAAGFDDEGKINSGFIVTDTKRAKAGDTDSATGARKSHSKVTFSGGNPLL